MGWTAVMVWNQNQNLTGNFIITQRGCQVETFRVLVFLSLKIENQNSRLQYPIDPAPDMTMTATASHLSPAHFKLPIWCSFIFHTTPSCLNEEIRPKYAFSFRILKKCYM